jgi:hypothetical protein
MKYINVKIATICPRSKIAGFRSKFDVGSAFADAIKYIKPKYNADKLNRLIRIKIMKEEITGGL